LCNGVEYGRELDTLAKEFDNIHQGSQAELSKPHDVVDAFRKEVPKKKN
jgi:hypothetical protein